MNKFLYKNPFRVKSPSKIPNIFYTLKEEGWVAKSGHSQSGSFWHFFHNSLLQIGSMKKARKGPRLDNSWHAIGVWFLRMQVFMKRLNRCMPSGLVPYWSKKNPNFLELWNRCGWGGSGTTCWDRAMNRQGINVQPDPSRRSEHVFALCQRPDGQAKNQASAGCRGKNIRKISCLQSGGVHIWPCLRGIHDADGNDAEGRFLVPAFMLACRSTTGHKHGDHLHGMTPLISFQHVRHTRRHISLPSRAGAPWVGNKVRGIVHCVQYSDGSPLLIRLLTLLIRTEGSSSYWRIFDISFAVAALVFPGFPDFDTFCIDIEKILFRTKHGDQRLFCPFYFSFQKKSISTSRVKLLFSFSDKPDKKMPLIVGLTTLWRLINVVRFGIW